MESGNKGYKTNLVHIFDRLQAEEEKKSKT